MESATAQVGLKNWFKKLQSLSKFFNKRKQKTYILPTKLGLMYGLLCFVLLLMAMAYGNNLVFIVCFFLTVMGMRVAQIINHTVSVVDIDSCGAENIFAEPDQKISVNVTNCGKIDLRGLELKLVGQSTFRTFNIRSGESLALEINWHPTKRGLTVLPTIHLSSSYPGDLFKAWKVFKPTESILVYPTRKGRSEFPDAAAQDNTTLGVLREIRDYKPGDSPKRIHWRSLAKNKQLRTMVHEGHEGKQCRFEWNQLAALPVEDQISQFALWVSLAEIQSYQWSIQLPEREFDSSRHGDAYRQVMSWLALWKGKK